MDINKRIIELEAENAKLRRVFHLPADDNICLNCGRLTPCNLHRRETAPPGDWPGSPCTFDLPALAEMRERVENAEYRLREKGVNMTNTEKKQIVETAIEIHMKLDINYHNEANEKKQRLVWPLEAKEHHFKAWCERVQQFRTFKYMNIISLKTTVRRFDPDMIDQPKPELKVHF